MNHFQSRLSSFFNNRWLVFVGAIWIQSVAGVGYLFGSMSPVIKIHMGYNQRQIATLGVAKDLGASVGFLAGILCEVLPLWSVLFIGALKKVVGYGWVWLIVTGRTPALPLWVMCLLIFVGNNGETYFNTAALVSCVQNFPESRGPIVGILKGFAGLSGAILTQIYAVLHSPDDTALIFMVAAGPSMVVIALMFIIRPVSGHRQAQHSDNSSFAFIYSVCLLLAAYLMAVMLLEDLVNLNHNVIFMFTAVLLIILVAPIMIPLILTFGSHVTSTDQECLLPKDPGNSAQSNEQLEEILSEVEGEKSEEAGLLPASERLKRNQELEAEVFQAAAVEAVMVKRRGPHRGENFTLCQALMKADFWLLFMSLLCGSGSGLTVIDNLGQISQSLGYDKAHIFVSMISIWNFLGRVGGGYLSEIVVRDHAYPRPIALAISQGVMAAGHFFIGVGWPGAMYIGTLAIGLGYGAHWAIAPAAASELFGMRNFGSLYSFLTCSSPGGSLIFSQLIASNIYDYEASKQAHERHRHETGLTEEARKCEGAVCFFLSSMIMSGFSVFAAILSSVLVYRTRIVYSNLFGKTRA